MDQTKNLTNLNLSKKAYILAAKPYTSLFSFLRSLSLISKQSICRQKYNFIFMSLQYPNVMDKKSIIGFKNQSV